MYEWIAVVLAGLVGGLANSYVSTGVLEPPTWIENSKGNTVLDPGSLGYIVIGGIAAFAMWALNMPAPSMSSTDVRPFALAGALLAGTGGSRVLSGLFDKVMQGANNVRSGRGIQQATNAGRALGALQGRTRRARSET